jgi:hypothetical protein
MRQERFKRCASVMGVLRNICAEQARDR